MAEPTIVDNAALIDYSVLNDEVTDPALGTGVVQYVKIMDGEANSTEKARVERGGIQVADPDVLALLEEMYLSGRSVTGEEIRSQSLTRSTDTISAALATDVIMFDDAPVAPQFGFANVAASQTDSHLISCPLTKRIKILSFRLHAGGTATNVTFNTRKPGGTGVACTELFACAANGGRAEGFNLAGHFQTNFNEDLSVTTGTGSTVGIGFAYVAI